MTKYSKDIIKEICGHIAKGMTQKDSCILAGISNETFHKWKKEKSEFSESLKKAEAKSKQKMIGIIQEAGKKSWQACAWFLERRYKEEYSLKQEVQHSGNVTFADLVGLLRKKDNDKSSKK